MRGAASLLLALTAVAASAQNPAPFVRAHIEPAARVTVGEPVRVVVDVLTPTWFLAAPRFGSLDVPDAIVLFQDSGINLSESVDGTTYSGLQREYLVYPMREGRHSVPPIEVMVVWAIDARPSPPTALATRPLTFEATVPAAARGLGYFVSARRLTLRQTLEPQPEGLTVGGALRRTVTVEAEEAFGMMLPPLAVAPIDGLQAYPDPPQVEDRPGERGAARVARRVDSVSFRLQRAGTYALPAVEVGWWDLGARRLKKASLPAVSFAVAPAPARPDEIPLPADAEAAPGAQASERSHWEALVPWLLAAAFAAVLLAWRLPPLARALRRILAALVAARHRRLDSEPAWFHRVRHAARRNQAAATYRALLAWAPRRPTPSGTLEGLVADAGDPGLANEIDRLGETLYARRREPAAWVGKRLTRQLLRARRQSRRGRGSADSALAGLNPTTGPAPHERSTP